MNVGLLLVIIGIVVAILVHFALGLALILIGIVLMFWQAGPGLRL